jgi:DNA-binding LacI/PurR family transcriptional regulator
MAPEISEGYSALVMSGIEDALLQAGYLYFVASHWHRAHLVDEYPQLMLDRSVMV